MATTTSNFGWAIPQSTDLVKDGATAIAALGNGVDTSMAELKGGTTGQILAKTSNTDMDFTWTTPNPGDITGVTAGTGLTGGGTSGDVTVSFDQSNYGGGQYAAGKNKIINGDFGIWQRGTSFTPAPGAGVSNYCADRFLTSRDGTGSTVTISRQSFTPGTAPVSGYEAQYFWRFAQSVAGTGATYTTAISQIVEGMGLAGQTVTLSFWAKADTARTLLFGASQFFGTGGSITVYTGTTSINITTSWARYSATITLPSIAGKTIGTGQVGIEFYLAVGALNTVQTIDIWGYQVEAGSTATPFQTATGTKQGELAACQRYYYRATGTSSTNQAIASGISSSSTNAYIVLPTMVTMRTAPTTLDYSGLNLTNTTTYTNAVSALTLDMNTANAVRLAATSTGGTANQPVQLLFQANGYIGLSAEL